MKSALKYLLLPVTIIAWFFMAYYVPYLAIAGTVKVFNVSWFVLIFFGSFVFGILYFVIVGLPNLIRVGIGVLYEKIPFVMILHGIAGVIGTIWIITFFINQPPMLVRGDQEFFFITGMWKYAPLKTLFVVLGVIPFIILMIYNSTIMPFVLFADMQKGITDESKAVIIDQYNDISGPTEYYKEPILDVEELPIDGLKPLEIQSTHNSPYVLFNPDGDLLIHGRSVHEDISFFFDSLYDWVSDYKNEPADETTLTVYFEYCNELTPKLLLSILKDLNSNCPNFIVKWKFEEEDEDMFELGEMLRRVSGCDFEFIEVL
jgi:hypothetical protein